MKLTIEDMQRLAEKRGGKCLSATYVNVSTKLLWQCAQGHQWEAPPERIKSGNWCPYCARNPRLTIEDMQKLVEKRGGKCLSETYTNMYTKLLWQCAQGHRWGATPRSIKRGRWCPYCNDPKGRSSTKRTIEDMQRLAAEYGGKCLSKTYVDARIKLLWQCIRGHQWRAIPGSIKNGRWCPYCDYRIGNNTKLTIEDMQYLAARRGGKCLSTTYVNVHTKLLWECVEDHQWEASPANIKKGTWCPYCAGMVKGTLAEMQRIAAERGGKCLSETYVNSKTGLLWQCAHGHQWEAKPQRINRGNWCPYCAGTVKITLTEMQQIARERGGKCLSETYVNSKTGLLWQCAHGHQWKARPSSIRRGTWCPYCAGIVKGTLAEMQQIAAKRGGRCLSKIYVNRRTKLLWECVEGHQWEASPTNIKLGEWCPYCARSPKRTIEDMQRLAEKRGGKCLSAVYINSRTKLLWECAEGHRWEVKPNSIKSGTWCPYCAGKMKGTLTEMQQIAAKRGGKCLSDVYVNTKTGLWWQCAKGHQWKASPGSIKMGSWCPYCAGRVRGTLAKMQQRAKKRGGKCLSTTYVNSRTKLLWECAEGHQWEARPADIKRGRWCPTCAKLKNRRKTLITG